MKKIELKQPYIVFLGDIDDPGYAKTGFGLVQWRPSACVAQLRFDNCEVDLGLPDIDVEQLSNHSGSLVIGVAARGGSIAEHWVPTLLAAAEAGLDIVAGTHTLACDIEELRAAALKSGASIIDVRVPPEGLPIATGASRAGRRLLTVGTDCAVGKKYTALALHQSMRDRGMDASFRATGQTGIMIAGSGIPIDAVVSDFTAGAAEELSPDADEKHWDVIEGQGSLFHPSYAGVSLGLLHGSQPDAIVLCHDASRSNVLGLEDYALPSLTTAIERNITGASLTNPSVRCVGISINTSGLDDAARDNVLLQYESETELPCVDPLVHGVGRIVDRIQEIWK